LEMNQYLDMFIEESKENLQAINKNLLLLEDEPENISIVQEIFRSAHTLKGMSATMGFEDLALLTHEMENVLDLIRNSKLMVTSDIMDVMFKVVDKLEGILVSIEANGDGKADVTHEISRLQAIVKGEPFSPSAKNHLQNNDSQVNDIKGIALPENYLDEYQVTVLNQSLQSGYTSFRIKVTLDEKTLLKAARAFMVFNAIEGLGEVIKTSPSVEEIEEEKFDHSFEIVMVSNNTGDEIQKAILNISEIQSVELYPITSESLSSGNQPSNPSPDISKDEKTKSGQKTETEKQQHGPVVKKSTSAKTIRVDIERLEALMNLFSELVIDRGRLEQISRELGHAGLSETVEHMNRISGDLQNIILNIRMVPVEQVFNRFPRMVRDLAKELNKKVNLTITGAETELDRTVIDEIGDPLVHLLRNAVDHGLESTVERLRSGKPETGEIHLRAFHSGNHVFIEVSDDGKGINREKVLKKAIQRGLVSAEEAETLTDQQVYQFLFASGFSTAQVISDISGRGVGLDVVKNKIESLGGAVSVYSQEGKGTTFSIQLPLTLSIISAMLVQVEEEKYAIPISSIIETAILKPSEILTAHRQHVIDFRGRIVPLVSLKKVFQVPGELERESEEVSVVIVRKGDKMAGLIVDSFIGQQEIVLKSLGNYLSHVFAISGATILGDGQVALIIDPNALIK
jgi:two-component system chemotaxis sensor kinase CheA